MGGVSGWCGWVVWVGGGTYYGRWVGVGEKCWCVQCTYVCFYVYVHVYVILGFVWCVGCVFVLKCVYVCTVFAMFFASVVTILSP